MKTLTLSNVLFGVLLNGQQAVKPLMSADGVEYYNRSVSPSVTAVAFWTEFGRVFTQWDRPAQLPFQKSIAFLVGVSEYQEKSGFRPLPGVENDLDHMREFLLDRGGFDEVYIARKSAATPAIVTRYMMNVFHDKSKIGTNDRLLFYYSGHGDVTGNKSPFMIFSKAVKDQFDSETTLKVKSYEDWSDRILAKHALFVFDACKAGEAFDHKSSSLAQGLSLNGSRLFVSAGTGDENAWYSSGGSIFTDLLLKVLKEGATDSGLVTIEEVVAKVKRMAAGIASKPGYTPMLPLVQMIDSSHEGTFIFLNPTARNQRLPEEARTLLRIHMKSQNEPTEAPETNPCRPYGISLYCRIPHGGFVMGCNSNLCSAYDKEHHVTVADDYYIGKYEVTVAEYKNYVSDLKERESITIPSSPSYNPNWVSDKLPMVNVTWDEAEAYCRAMHGRLPSDEEWELAARGGKSTQFPWGNNDDPGKAMFARKKPGPNAPAEGDKFPPNKYGLVDVAGNVAEWTSGQKDDDHKRAVRGGSYLTLPTDIGSRLFLDPRGHVDVGFRCVVPVGTVDMTVQ